MAKKVNKKVLTSLLCFSTEHAHGALNAGIKNVHLRTGRGGTGVERLQGGRLCLDELP